MVFSGLFLEDIGINNLILIHVNYWNFKKSEIFKNSSYAVHMVSFENFVKLVSPSLWELKVTPNFCFAFKIPDNVTASKLTRYLGRYNFLHSNILNHHSYWIIQKVPAPRLYFFQKILRTRLFGHHVYLVHKYSRVDDVIVHSSSKEGIRSLVRE